MEPADSDQVASVLQAGRSVYLRLPLPNDQDELIALTLASRELHRGWISPPASAEEFASYLERSRQQDCAYLLVCRSDDQAIIGAVNLSQIFRRGFQNAYMGYYIGAPFAQRGYMLQAVALTLDYAFGPLALHRIEANIQPHNTPSIALVRRLGFTREGYSRRYLQIDGEWCDHERWAILAEDWRAVAEHDA